MTSSVKPRPLTAKYERPVPATLVVRLETGEEWEATAEDLARFGAAVKLDLYSRFSDLLVEALGLEPGTDLTRDDAHHGANLVRYLVECAVVFDHSPWANEHGQPWPEDDDSENFREVLQSYLLRDPDWVSLNVTKADTARAVIKRLLEGWTPFVDRSGVALLGTWQSEHGPRADENMTPAERDLVAELRRECGAEL